MQIIPLTKGLVTLVDDEDYEKLAGLPWSALVLNTNTYAVNNKQYMHRIILGAPEDLWVDHINGSGLDNRRNNLRLCTPAQNSANTQGRGAKSGFKGVFQQTGLGDTWFVRLVHEDRIYRLGTYRDKREAALVYDRMARKLSPGFAHLNFPDEILPEEAPLLSRVTPSYLYWNKQKQKWQVALPLYGKRKHVGFFSTEAEAIAARDKAFKEINGYDYNTIGNRSNFDGGGYSRNRLDPGQERQLWR
jgi:hypothetical protein